MSSPSDADAVLAETGQRFGSLWDTCMLDSVVAYASNLDFADFNRVFHSSPAVKSRLLATIGRVQQEEVDVAKTTFFDGLLDRLASSVI
jgi:hypothetical protein